MIPVTLSRPDMALARWIGRERNAAKVGLPSRKYLSTAMTDEEIHVLGAMAEVAVARLFGIEPDRRFYRHGDGGVDLRLGGRTFDVKMRSRRGADLLIQPDMSDFRADYIVLCWPGNAPNTVEIVGTVGRVRFRAQASDTVLVAPPRLVLPWQALTPVGVPGRVRVHILHRRAG